MEEWRDAIMHPPKKPGEFIVYDIERDEVISAAYNPELYGESQSWRTSEEYFVLNSVIAWMPMPMPPHNDKYACWQGIFAGGQPGEYKCSFCGDVEKGINLYELPITCPNCGKIMVNSR